MIGTFSTVRAATASSFICASKAAAPLSCSVQSASLIIGHAVLQPQMIAGDRREFLFPPLPGDLIGEQARIHRMPDARRG